MMDFLSRTEFHQFYSANLRGSLFSAFLTLSGFLFSAHTFIITHMKKEMYDTEEYQKRVTDLRRLNENLTYYGNLRRLSGLLVATIVMTLIASVLQLTLGLIPANWSAILCLIAAGCAIIGLVVDILLMWGNLRQWFTDVEAATAQRQKTPPVTPPVNASS